jgi:hypothetical protein
MANSYKFGIIRFTSHPIRGESLNIGLVVETEGGLITRYPARLDKLRAISAALDIPALEHDLRELPIFMLGLGQTQLEAQSFARALSSFSSFEIGQRGEISAAPELFEAQIADLMSRYVLPEPAIVKSVRKPVTKLRRTIRDALKSERILARPSEGLESHRVVFQHKISEGIVADFVLRNGAMHVVESIDVSSENVSLHRALVDIAMSALTFEHARIEFSNQEVKPRLVYQASVEVENSLRPSLYAAEHQGAEIVNWSSQDDRNKLLVELSSLASSFDERKRHPSLFHASTLPSQKLN